MHQIDQFALEISICVTYERFSPYFLLTVCGAFVFNSGKAIAEAIIGLLLVFTKRSIGFLSVFFFVFTGSIFVHAAFGAKNESEKSLHSGQIFAEREVSCHPLRSVNDYSTLRSVLDRIEYKCG